MSALDEIARRATACAVDVCWRQWHALAGPGAPRGLRPVDTVVDPEALVLMSLAVREHERRLEDRLRWWAGVGASLLSIQRMRTLLAAYPATLRSEVAWFAAIVVEAGDPRWKVLIDEPGAEVGGRPVKGPRELGLLEPATLMLRLRAGFGVGAKSDLLAFLIGTASRSEERAAWATVDVIATATAYSVASIRRAVTDMVLARLVTESAGRPARYSVDVRAWARLLRLQGTYTVDRAGVADQGTVHGLPAWRYWSQLFGFLAACTSCARDPELAAAAPVVQASRLRDLAESFRRVLEWNGIAWVDPRMFAGERYLKAFAQLVDGVVTWVADKS